MTLEVFLQDVVDVSIGGFIPVVFAGLVFGWLYDRKEPQPRLRLSYQLYLGSLFFGVLLLARLIEQIGDATQTWPRLLAVWGLWVLFIVARGLVTIGRK